jgi:hypothetical protein
MDLKSTPWLILTDTEKIIRAEGFDVRELTTKIKEISDAEK